MKISDHPGLRKYQGDLLYLSDLYTLKRIRRLDTSLLSAHKHRAVQQELYRVDTVLCKKGQGGTD